MRQTTTFNFASAARDLGKANLARQIVDDLQCEPPDPSIEPRILVLASSVGASRTTTGPAPDRCARAVTPRAVPHVPSAAPSGLATARPPRPMTCV